MALPSQLGWLGGPWGAALSSIGLPMLFGALAGRHDPYRRQMRRVQHLTSPWAIEQEERGLFQRGLSSPQFNMARSETIGAGQAGQAAIQRNLAQQGLLKSGVGNAMLGAAAAAPGIHLGRLTAGLGAQSQQQATMNAFRRAGLLAGMPPEQNTFGDFSAAGMNALIPYLMQLMSRQNQFGGGRDMGPGSPANTDYYG